MWLLLIVTLISFSISFMSIITKPLIHYLLNCDAEENRLKASITAERKVLSGISAQKNYTDYVIQQRKIVALEQLLEERKRKNYQKNMLIKYGLSYCCQFIVGIILGCISLYNISVPIVTFDRELFKLSPFGMMLAFPTGVENSISVPMWIFVSNYVSRAIAGYLK